MKKLTYYYRSETETDEMQSEEILYKQERFCTPSQLETELAIAKSISYNGEVTVEDDGEPEPPPTEQEQLRADVDFLLAMGGVL